MRITQLKNIVFKMRLPDIYYTTQQVDGTLQQDGTPDPAKFSQGEDVVLSLYAEYNGTPINELDNWIITAEASSTYSNGSVFWTGVKNNGLYYCKNEKGVQIIIPNTETATLFAGTYWIDLIIKQAVGTGDKKDLTVKLATFSFNIEYTASSPNSNQNRSVLVSTLPTEFFASNVFAYVIETTSGL